MRLSTIITKLEEYLDEFTNSYEITKIAINPKYKYKITVIEDDCSYYLFVDEDGELYNSDGKLLDAARQAYDFDQEIIEWIDKFEEKWRIK